MKTIIIFVLTFSLPLHVFATAQAPDILIYKGDTLSLYASPLQKHPNIDSLRLKMFGEEKVNFWRCNTACGNDYLAVWTIIDDQLYLINIHICCKITNDDKDYLRFLFGKKYVDGKVKADWVTGIFISPQGKLLYYIHDAYESIYEQEVEFYFEKGRLTGTQLYDNSKSKQSVYSWNFLKMTDYIYSSINWKILPISIRKVKIIIEFSANENGIIDDVKVLRGYNKIYDQEAIRIIKSIPEWDVYYRRGEFKRIPWRYQIVFSNKNKLKYKKKLQL